MSEKKTVTNNEPSSDEGYIFPTGEYQGVPYFKPPVGFCEEPALKEIGEANRLNNLQAVSLPVTLFPVKNPISVSFVYAHPADYYGEPMLHAGVEDWKKHFRRFKKMHIDTVIFQAALWRELNECYYQSKAFSFLKCYGVVEKMLQAAAEESIHVYMGGYGSVAGWKARLTKEELEAEVAEHRKCFEELSQLGTFDGMYFPSETSFRTKRLPEKEQRMNYLYRRFSDMVKEKNPHMKIIVSPATSHKPEYNDIFCDFWNAVMQNSHVDILMPQDCIGNAHSQLVWLPDQWKAWKSVADAHGIELWSHTEIFERRGFRPEYNLFPAAPERVAAQLIQTAPYVTRHCCWEALSFASDRYGEEGSRLQYFMENGTVPVK
ncbi:MAG: DUF4434 domain-containing protein [Lentisphaeria bacterium]|nr:DUF4434 domain-containing protein [Lentisphaeria bacterium]